MHPSLSKTVPRTQPGHGIGLGETWRDMNQLFQLHRNVLSASIGNLSSTNCVEPFACDTLLHRNVSRHYIIWNLLLHKFRWTFNEMLAPQSCVEIFIEWFSSTIVLDFY